jgi:hypothetical protein
VHLYRGTPARAARMKWGKRMTRPRPPSESPISSSPRRTVRLVNWWTQSQPIRTLAEMHVTFALLETRPLFLYERVAEKARELSRLGMSASAIARTLKISDKTVSKALR